MKDYWKLILVTALTGAGIYATAYSVYTATLVSDPALAYSNTYTLNLSAVNPSGFSDLSAQAVYSTATMATNTFTDGSVSTGSVTVLNNALLAANAATNQITIAATSVILAASATDYLVVLTTYSLMSSSAIVTYNGNPLRAGHEWTVVDTATGTAANLRAALAKFHGVTASRTDNEIDLTATPAGVGGNARTLAVNVSSITVGGGKFGSGHNSRLDNAYLTVNGRKYYQGTSWSVTDTSSGTARSIAAFLGRVSGLVASSSNSVVYATATVAGAAGNAYTLVSSQPSYMTVSGATFAGGRDNAKVCIKGVCLTQGTNWTKASTSTGTAKSISDAIVGNATLASVVTSTWTEEAVVTATSSVTGSDSNYTLTTNVPSYLTLSGSAFTGGTSAAWTALGSALTIANHGLATGYAVVYTTNTAVGLAPLVYNTTYYAARLSASAIALSTTSAQAVTGSYIALAAPVTTGPHTFTLTPVEFSGQASWKWQSSNDNVNWSDVSISSVTFATPYTPDVVAWDFGHFNYKYLRLNFVKPTQGAVALTVTLNGTR